jgi:hypothetical protein
MIEDITSPTSLSELSQIFVIASSMRLQKDNENSLDAGISSNSRLNGDGSFSLSGLRPGYLRISAHIPSQLANLVFVRTERNGLDVTQGFEVKAGEQVADLRIVLAQANCKIRGQVKVEGGTFIKNEEMRIRAVRITGNEFLNSRLKYYSALLDPNRRFLMSSLLAGEYELIVDARISLEGKNNNEDAEANDKQSDRWVFRTAKQRVNVLNGQDVEVTLVLKAREKDE